MFCACPEEGMHWQDDCSVGGIKIRLVQYVVRFDLDQVTEGQHKKDFIIIDKRVTNMQMLLKTMGGSDDIRPL